jgi:hypothetical protein
MPGFDVDRLRRRSGSRRALRKNDVGDEGGSESAHRRKEKPRRALQIVLLDRKVD